MKVTILKENLKEALAVVARLGQKNLSLPILNSVLLETEKNFLCLKATDLEVGIKWWVLAKVEKEGKIACPAKPLQGLVDSLAAEKITFKTDEKNLEIETENTRAQIVGQNAEDFPIIPEPEVRTSFQIDRGAFVSALEQVVDFAAVSPVKPEITGIYFSLQGNQLQVVATDSFRLAQKTLFLATKPEVDFSAILPQKSCRELINIFGNQNEAPTLKVSFSGNQFLAESFLGQPVHPKVRFLSRLIEGEYPNYQEILPQDFKFQAVVAKNDLLGRLRSASFFANKINEIKLEFEPKKQEMVIFGQNAELGQFSSRLSAKITGETTQLSFNWRFLMEGLNQIPGQEFVFRLSQNDGPAVLEGVEASDYLYLLMPLRV